jgi:hypothetical protein
VNLELILRDFWAISGPNLMHPNQVRTLVSSFDRLFFFELDSVEIEASKLQAAIKKRKASWMGGNA